MSTEMVSATIFSTRESTPLCPTTGVTRDAHPDKSAPAAPIDTKKLRRDWRRSATHSVMFFTPERRHLVPASLHFGPGRRRATTRAVRQRELPQCHLRKPAVRPRL